MHIKRRVFLDLDMYRNHIKLQTQVGKTARRTILVIFLHLLFVYLTSFSERDILTSVDGGSISHGVSHQQTTEHSQFMPKLCQNQSKICEGSFCIPGINRCVCDLRLPVQFDRFCLRQVDIDSKCFATSQCNHTVKDAVCIDINSNSILDIETSKFKLDQWQQLNELRQMSQSSSTRNTQASNPGRQVTFITPNKLTMSMLLLDDHLRDPVVEAKDDEIKLNVRNSPYEINYNTHELLLQNHTRRRTNATERALDSMDLVSTTSLDGVNSTLTSTQTILASNYMNQESVSSTKGTIAFTSMDLPTNKLPISTTSTLASRDPESTTVVVPTTISNSPQTQTSFNQRTASSTQLEGLVNRKMVTKTPHWPPGTCSCPFGFMFDLMLRKCMALSLSESHCLMDSACKNIANTHCSKDTKKCECDEPFVWDQRELACLRPKLDKKDVQADTKIVVDNSLSPSNISSKLFFEHTNFLLILFLFVIVLVTLIIIESNIKCFSSKNSALISPKRQHKKTNKQTSNPNHVSPKSPYGTIRKSDHNSQLSDFTQATRGRILNYDFEQDSPKAEATQPLTTNTLKITFLLLF